MSRWNYYTRQPLEDCISFAKSTDTSSRHQLYVQYIYIYIYVIIYIYIWLYIYMYFITYIFIFISLSLSLTLSLPDWLAGSLRLFDCRGFGVNWRPVAIFNCDAQKTVGFINTPWLKYMMLCHTYIYMYTYNSYRMFHIQFNTLYVIIYTQWSIFPSLSLQSRLGCRTSKLLGATETFLTSADYHIGTFLNPPWVKFREHPIPLVKTTRFPIMDSNDYQVIVITING